MNLNYYIKKAITMGPQELAKKVVNKINTKFKNKIQKTKDLSKSTRINFNVPLIQNSYIDVKQFDTSNIDSKVAKYLSQMYCEHRFDLLGSGWVKNSYDSVALGVEGYKYNMNVSPSQSVASGYESIDWQKDYKSGYRWSENTWYKDIKFGDKLGVDIKVPWELSRLQHLPQLAIFTIVDENLKEQNIKEFKHQILDFIANNPPRMGVNWVCTMDVGIRVANMLVAYDMFTQIDSFGMLDDEFKQIFVNSIYEHGVHIVNNLEYSEFGRNNHYLSDIAGLLFVSAYLENNDQIRQWLAFSIQEIINEMDYEFYEDGGNFESSTSYHRLSGELMVYSTALIVGLNENKINALQDYSPKRWKVRPKLEQLQNQQFKINNLKLIIELPQWYIDKLYKIGRFTVDITKPNGEIPQLGDNDSGRFFRLSPSGEFLTNKEAVNRYLNLKGYKEDDEPFWDENILNHNTFVSCFDGLYSDKIFKKSIGLEKSFIKAFAKQKLKVSDKSYKSIEKSGYSLEGLNYQKTTIYNFKLSIIGSQLIAYPNSGIYIFKTNDFYLNVGITPLGQKDNGGHSHNDKLSYELHMDGKDLVKDPGTYLYTPMLDRRNSFRSVKAHMVPIIENHEQNHWIDGYRGLFHLMQNSTYFVKDFGRNFLEIVLEFNNFRIMRRFEIRKNSLEVTDISNQKVSYTIFNMYSNGYGKVQKI